MSDEKEVSETVLEDLSEGEKGRKLGDIDFLQDIELEVRVEFARVKKSIEEILELAEGDIVKLNRFAGEPVDLFVDDKKFAKGELTVVDDNFGVRITEILPPKERID